MCITGFQNHLKLLLIKLFFSMNNKTSINYLIIIIAPLFFGCGGPVTEGNKNNALASSVSQRLVGTDKYIIDTGKSVVEWKGSMLLGKQEHTGYVQISNGELMFEKGELLGGTVEMNMNSIEYKDKKHKNSPIKHLKSPDYFDVQKFPISTFAITQVTSTNGEDKQITGNLTIKGITHPVTFPVKIEVNGAIVKAYGELVIDRTVWGILYKSGMSFNSLADEIVSDDIGFRMNLVAKK